jgi:hypothetical protein
MLPNFNAAKDKNAYRFVEHASRWTTAKHSTLWLLLTKGRSGLLVGCSAKQIGGFWRPKKSTSCGRLLAKHYLFVSALETAESVNWMLKIKIESFET